MNQVHYQEKVFLSSHSKLFNSLDKNAIKISENTILMAIHEDKTNLTILKTHSSTLDRPFTLKYKLIRKDNQSFVKDVAWIKVYNRKKQRYQFILVVLSATQLELWYYCDDPLFHTINQSNSPNTELFTLMEVITWDRSYVGHQCHIISKYSTILLQDTQGTVIAKKLTLIPESTQSPSIITTTMIWSPLLQKVQILHIDEDENVFIVLQQHDQYYYYPIQEWNQHLYQYFKHGEMINLTMKQQDETFITSKNRLEFPVNHSNLTSSTVIHTVCKLGDCYALVVSDLPMTTTAHSPSLLSSYRTQDKILSTVLQTTSKPTFTHILPDGKTSLLQALHVPENISSSPSDVVLQGLAVKQQQQQQANNMLSTKDIVTIHSQQQHQMLSAGVVGTGGSVMDALYNISSTPSHGNSHRVHTNANSNTAISQTKNNNNTFSLQFYLPEIVTNNQDDNSNIAYHLRHLDTIPLDNMHLLPSVMDMSTSYTLLQDNTASIMVLGSSQSQQIVVLHITHDFAQSSLSSIDSTTKTNKNKKKRLQVHILNMLTLSDEVSAIHILYLSY